MTISSQTTKKFVLSFRDHRPEEQSLAGGKGGALAYLKQVGFPVPDGFIIVPEAFEEDQLRPDAWDQIQSYIKQMLKTDKKASFAVRSSALAEDSAFAAFAGQFETVLDVQTDEEIQKAIHTVYQSKLSDRVISYSKAKGIDFKHEIAIVVQKLVHSEISGVIFTADPVTGSINIMSGSYVYGMGDQLVSGETDAAEFSFERPKGQYSGPPEFKKYAKQLYSLAKRVEEEFRVPQDIEWAISKGKVYLLQSRPITTLLGYDPVTGFYNESLKGDYLWASAGVGEIVPDVMKPSEWSIWHIYNNECMEHDWFLPHLLYANIAGRMYTNGSVMVSVMRKFRYSEERIKDIFAEAMGELPPEMIIPTFHVSFKTILTSTIPNEIKWQRTVKKLQKKIPSFLATHAGLCGDLKAKILQTKDKPALTKIWKEELKPAYHEAIWMMKVANEVFYNPLNQLSIELGKIVGKSDSNILIQGRPKGVTQLESIGPLIGLKDILEGKLSREEYMEKYGHRDPKENYLAYPRPAEDPSWLDEQLKNS